MLYTFIYLLVGFFLFFVTLASGKGEWNEQCRTNIVSALAVGAIIVFLWPLCILICLVCVLGYLIFGDE